MSDGVKVGLLRASRDRDLIGLDPHPSQCELLKLIERNRLVVAACGRRWGKTKAAAAGAIWNLCLSPEADAHVSRGETRYGLSVGNSREQARIFLEHCATLLKNSPTLRHELLEQNVNELVLRSDRRIAAMPCTAKSIRGYAASYVVLDEFAHHYSDDDGGATVAERVWAALTPSVSQFGKHGRVVVISTPLGENLFSKLFQQAKTGEIPAAAAFHAPSWANPLLDATYLKAQEVALGPDDYRREFGAEWIAGGSAFIEDAAIRACVGDYRERLPGDGVRWVASLDPSFNRDPTALVLAGRDPSDRSRLLVGHVETWQPPRKRRGVGRSREDEDAVVGRVLDGVARVCARFGVADIISDQHLPDLVKRELAARGLRCEIVPWTATSKTEALVAVRALIYTRKIELLDNHTLVSELGRLRSRLRGGSSQVETPKVGDTHCDTAVALAAAVVRLDRAGGGGELAWPKGDYDPGGAGRLRSREF